MKQLPLAISIGLGFMVCCGSAAGFTLVENNEQAVIVIQNDEKPYIHRAVEDLLSDIKKITGRDIARSDQPMAGCSNLIIGTVGQSRLIPTEFFSLKGQWEVYALKTSGADLVIAGSNPRGALFGIYYFIEEYLGVDPFYWWKDLEPGKRDSLVFEAIDYTSREPDFKFRGWFINDEDLMTGYRDGGGKRELDYPFYKQVVHPEVMERVVEAAVRLRFNLIIPASFLEIFNPAERKLLDVASRRGLYLSQHHIEPLGVSAFGYFNYWKRKTGEKPLFSYYSEKEKVVEVWRESARRWSQYPNVIWQIGLRGIADRPMWMADPGVPQSNADRGAIISDAMQTQMDILNELLPGGSKEVTTTLWAEGALLNELGHLRFPQNTTIVFADNSPGWVMQNDFYKTKREPHINYGIYYHHGLIGSGPHLAQAVPPAKTREIFSLAVTKDSHYYAIMNVGNVREFVLGVAASRDMLEDLESFNADTWLKRWCRESFKDNTGAVYEAYQSFFRAYQEDDTHGTPLLLDGLARAKANNNLRFVKNALETGIVKATQKKQSHKKQKDAFYQSLAKMHPGGNITTERLLEQATTQDRLFALALAQAEKAAARLSGAERTLLENNLIAHIKFMQCLTGWVVESTRAVAAIKKQDLAATRKHLELALAKFKLYEEATALCSRGKWEGWYRDERKINVKHIKQTNEDVLATIKQKLKNNGPQKKTATLSIDGQRFKLNGKLYDMWGVRTASASQNQTYTDHLIAQLDDYKAHGINTVVVYYQGSSGGNSDPFSPDGRSIDPDHQHRMEQIISACDKRGMVTIVGIFYQMKPVGGVRAPVHLHDWDACLRAVRTVTERLKPFDNIIINIANEQNSHGHSKFPWKQVGDSKGIIACCKIVKETDPTRLVGGGGYDHDKNEVIGLSPWVDVLLFDTLGPDKQKHSGYYYDQFVDRGIKKPIVNVETFGAWSRQFIPQGVYSSVGKQAFFKEVDDGLARPGLSICFFCNAWHQGPALDLPLRYDLAGVGTEESPGTRWYFQYVMKIRQRVNSQ